MIFRRRNDPLSRIRRGVAKLARREAAGVTIVEIQPLLMVVGEPSYEQFLVDWTRAWRRGEYSTAAWSDGAVAADLSRRSTTSGCS